VLDGREKKREKAEPLPAPSLRSLKPAKGTRSQRLRGASVEDSHKFGEGMKETLRSVMADASFTPEHPAVQIPAPLLAPPLITLPTTALLSFKTMGRLQRSSLMTNLGMR
jgi:hypothetical protein